MIEAAVEERWNHTASVLAMLANCHSDPKKGRFSPQDFMPDGMGRRVEATPADLHMLRQAAEKKRHRGRKKQRGRGAEGQRGRVRDDG